MTARHETIEVRTRGKGTYEITEQVAAAVGKSGIRTGIVSIFIRHTSASLVIYENADSSAIGSPAWTSPSWRRAAPPRG